jgi:hypothetical protein
MTSPSATQDRYPYQNEPIWSRSEKIIARKAFDAALGRDVRVDLCRRCDLRQGERSLDSEQNHAAGHPPAEERNR